MNGFIIKGTVASGMGKARRFMAAKGYKEQFASILGIDSYDGTLNVKVPAQTVARLKGLRGIRINGFREGERNFGGLTAFQARISGTKCALVIPDMGTHTEMIELIAEKNLKESLSLKDGDEVSVVVSVSGPA